MIFRIRFSVGGGHVSCHLFSAKAANQTFARCGYFIVTRGEEFIALTKAFAGAEFVEEAPGVSLFEATNFDENKELAREPDSGK